MKKAIVLSMLILSACASSSRAMRSSAESFEGPWQGVLVKGQTRSRVDLRFSESEGGYTGFFWGRSLMPVPLNDLRLGSSVHFEIPAMGVFDGTSVGGETIQGTFRDGSGEGTFKLEKESDWNDPIMAP